MAKAYKPPAVEYSYTERDAMLYALGGKLCLIIHRITNFIIFVSFVKGSHLKSYLPFYAISYLYKL